MLKRILLTIAVLLAPLALAMPAYAVSVTDEACSEISTSAICKEAQAGKNTNPLFGPEGVLTTAVSIMSFVVGVAAVITLIIAGIRFSVNGSNPQEITKARNTIIYASVGIIIAVLAQGIVKFILEKL